MNLLIIEDHQKMALNIASILEAEGFHVDIKNSGKEGLEKAGETPFDVIILDLSLPDTDGLKICGEMRRKGIGCPILILTARIGLEDKVEGLDQGADDYLTKPFMAEELLARVRALTRRKNKPLVSLISLDSDIRVDLSAKKVFREDTSINLSPTEYKIFELLAEHKGESLSTTMVYEKIWGNDREDVLFSERLKVHIARLRRKLGDNSIETVKGYGYRVD